MGSFTIRLHRVLSAPPERVYRAFLDAPAMAKWLPPEGFTATLHQHEPRVGGRFRMSFTNFTSGNSHSFGGEYLELVPNERLRYTDVFDDANLPGTMQVTVVLRRVPSGTDLQVTQEGRRAGRDTRGRLLPGLAAVAAPARGAGRTGDPGLRRSGWHLDAVPRAA